MIKTTDLSRLRNGEFVKFSGQTASIVNNHDVAELKIKTQAQALKSAHADMLLVYKADRGSKLTKAMVNEDITRDGLNMGILLILDAHVAYHPDQEKRKKARLLLDTFEKHGRDIARHSYHLQTANLDDIIEDIEKKGLMDLISMFYLDAYFKGLKESNKKFDKLYIERNKEYAQTPKEKLGDLRMATEDALTNLFDRINAYITLDGVGPYASLVDELNTHIQTYAGHVKMRSGKNIVGDESLNQDFDEAQE